MLTQCSLTVRKMRAEDLSCVLKWRSHPDIRRFMLSQHEITLAEHYAWFEKASKNESQRLLIIEEYLKPLGCVIFSDIDKGGTTNWSFYAAPFSPSGSGTKICSTALDYAFKEIGVHKVAGQVLDFNVASIRLHVRLGFKLEGTLREHVTDNDSHHDLLCFGILSRDWPSRVF